MITRRIVLSRAALGAAAVVSSIGLARIPAMAHNGNGDPVQERRRDRRRDRKERRREQRRDRRQDNN